MRRLGFRRRLGRSPAAVPLVTEARVRLSGLGCVGLPDRVGVALVAVQRPARLAAADRLGAVLQVLEVVRGQLVLLVGGRRGAAPPLDLVLDAPDVHARRGRVDAVGGALAGRLVVLAHADVLPHQVAGHTERAQATPLTLGSRRPFPPARGGQYGWWHWSRSADRTTSRG